MPDDNIREVLANHPAEQPEVDDVPKELAVESTGDHEPAIVAALRVLREQVEAGEINFDDLQEAVPELEASSPNSPGTIATRRLFDEFQTERISASLNNFPLNTPEQARGAGEISPTLTREQLPDPKDYVPIVATWLKDQVGPEVYSTLAHREMVTYQEKLLTASASLWRPFLALNKWSLAPKGNKFELKDKTDTDAKVMLLLLRDTGLDHLLARLQKEPVGSGAEAEKIPPGEWLSKAESMQQVLDVAGLIKPEQERTFRVLGKIATHYLNGTMFSNREQFCKPSTVRGLQQFLSADKLKGYVEWRLKKLTHKPLGAAVDAILDRPILTEDEQRGLGLIYTEHKNGREDEPHKLGLIQTAAKGGRLVNRIEQRRSMVNQAKELLDKPMAELVKQGRVMRTVNGGAIFVNVERKLEDRFPAGGAAVAAWQDATNPRGKKFDYFLNMQADEKERITSMLFRDLHHFRVEKLNLPKLPPDLVEVQPGMFLKIRGGEPWPLTPAALAEQLAPGYKARGILLKAAAIDSEKFLQPEVAAKTPPTVFPPVSPAHAEHRPPRIEELKHRRESVSPEARVAAQRKLTTVGKGEAQEYQLIRHDDGKPLRDPFSGLPLSVPAAEVANQATPQVVQELAQRFLERQRIFDGIMQQVNNPNKVREIMNIPLHLFTEQSVRQFVDSDVKATALVTFVSGQLGAEAIKQGKGRLGKFASEHLVTLRHKAKQEQKPAAA